MVIVTKKIIDKVYGICWKMLRSANNEKQSIIYLSIASLHDEFFFELFNDSIYFWWLYESLVKTDIEVFLFQSLFCLLYFFQICIDRHTNTLYTYIPWSLHGSSIFNFVVLISFSFMETVWGTLYLISSVNWSEFNAVTFICVYDHYN